MTVTKECENGKPVATNQKITVYNGRINPRPTTPRGKRRVNGRSNDAQGKVKVLYAEGDEWDRKGPISR